MKEEQNEECKKQEKATHSSKKRRKGKEKVQYIKLVKEYSWVCEVKGNETMKVKKEKMYLAKNRKEKKTKVAHSIKSVVKSRKNREG